MICRSTKKSKKCGKRVDKNVDRKSYEMALDNEKNPTATKKNPEQDGSSDKMSLQASTTVKNRERAASDDFTSPLRCKAICESENLSPW